jgi:hypothetical protein
VLWDTSWITIDAAITVTPLKAIHTALSPALPRKLMTHARVTVVQHFIALRYSTSLLTTVLLNDATAARALLLTDITSRGWLIHINVFPWVKVGSDKGKGRVLDCETCVEKRKDQAKTAREANKARVEDKENAGNGKQKLEPACETL